MKLAARPASLDDAERIAQIYNEGIEDRVGTFETRPRTADDIRAWFDGRHPIVVVDAAGAGVIAFASTSTYRPRECYAASPNSQSTSREVAADVVPARSQCAR